MERRLASLKTLKYFTAAGSQIIRGTLRLERQAEIKGSKCSNLYHKGYREPPKGLGGCDMITRIVFKCINDKIIINKPQTHKVYLLLTG